MKIPKTLKIGGHQVKVEMRALEGSTCGEWDARKNTITLDPNFPPDQLGSTLIHEILHAMNVTLGSDRMGHSLHDSLSEQLYQVLSDNKLLK